MTDKLVIIAEFPDINQAMHAQMHLESAGIDSFLEEANVAPMMPFISPGGKLKVKESEAQRALEILNEKEPDPEVVEEAQATKYAGFWIRAFAHICDGIVLGVLYLPVRISLPVIIVASPGIYKESAVATYLLFIIIDWLYFALMESSGYQATFGKRFFGITVSDSAGKRISFLRASARHWSKLLSVVTLGIGFIMAGLTLRKQALHDIMANCLVTRKYHPAKDKL